jgi:RNA-splicing ligase RtcB
MAGVEQVPAIAATWRLQLGSLGSLGSGNHFYPDSRT